MESIKLLAGPQILGLLLNWGLQGALTVQIYFYHLAFPRDPLANKLLVYGLFLYEWTQTSLMTSFTFDVYVYGFGDPNAVTAFHNSWFSVTIMSAVVSAIVQTFFGMRIWVIARSRVLCAIIFFLAFAQMSVGIAGGIMLRVLSPSAAAFSNVTPVISSWLAGAAFVDVLIAGTMTYFLWKAKRGGNSFSDRTLNRLIVLVVETGSLTAAFALADLVCFTTASNTLLHELFAVVLAKLYANTLLVSLNNRAYMKMRAGDSYNLHTMSGAFGSGSGSGGGGASSRTAHHPALGQISVRSETVVAKDGEYGMGSMGKNFGDGFGVSTSHSDA